MCLEEVYNQHIQDHQGCCEEEAWKVHHELNDVCHNDHASGQLDDNQHEECLTKSKEALGHALEVCSPEQNCWETAHLSFMAGQLKCNKLEEPD
jgi:hypothetical protein